MANNVNLGQGNITATGTVRGYKVRAHSLSDFEVGDGTATNTLEGAIRAWFANLDPDTSSVADVINALKGVSNA